MFAGFDDDGLGILDEPSIKAIFDFSLFKYVSETPVSQVVLTRYRPEHPGQLGEAVAVKSAYTLIEVSKEPHDIKRELKIMSTLSHVNVIEVLGRSTDDVSGFFHYWMPYISHKLRDLLDLRSFSPYSIPVTEEDELALSPAAADFTDLSRSLLFQLISAIAYLHHPSQGVAHRDIKPSNVLIADNGCIKLIDFGISWNENISSSSDCLWPEPSGSLCFDVSTGPYRAPELLFGARDYDPFATDLWSLGTLCAEFFTTLRSDADSEEEEEDSDEDREPGQPFILPRGCSPTSAQWYRDSLFDSNGGGIGLAWSLFQIRGTPTEESWPTFTSLPDGNKVSFKDVPPVDLMTLLPNAPPGDHPPFTGSHSPSPHMSSSPIDLIYRLLVYSPEKRLKTEDALKHPWFISDPLVLPEGYPDISGVPIRSKRLADIFMPFM